MFICAGTAIYLEIYLEIYPSSLLTFVSVVPFVTTPSVATVRPIKIIISLPKQETRERFLDLIDFCPSGCTLLGSLIGVPDLRSNDG